MVINNSKRSVADILAGLGVTETTSPVLVALISPVVPITADGIVEVKELFNNYMNKIFASIRCFQVNEVPSNNGRFFYKFSTDCFSTRSWASSWNELLYQMVMERYYHHDPLCGNDVTDELLEVLSKFIIDKSKFLQGE